MGKLTDVDIRNWIVAGQPVAKSDGDGLTFTMSARQAAAKSGTWVLRYRLPGMKSQKEIKVGIINYKAQLPPESNARQDGFWNEIKDIPGVTLVAEASSPVAEEAIKKSITSVVFDRNGFVYHGRIKAVADGAREGGLNF